jgi:hypothetical protein
MAQSRPAPAAGPVADPGGPSWGSPASIGGSPASPPVSAPVSRQGTSLPVNTPMTQPAPQLSGGSPAPAIQPVSGVGSWRVAGPVADPGATRLPISSTTSTIGYPMDMATPAGGDPSALGTSYVTTDADAPQWSQFNITFNPNPGALSGGMTTAPALMPGETPINQVSPEANPNRGGL